MRDYYLRSMNAVVVCDYDWASEFNNSKTCMDLLKKILIYIYTRKAIRLNMDGL